MAGTGETAADHLPTTEAAAPGTEALLTVQELKVAFPTADGLVRSVDGLSFELRRGETLAIVGESGSGKSVTGQAILGLHRRSKARVSGRILYRGRDLNTLGNRQLRELRGGRIAMVFQDPLSAFHPYYTIGRQIIEAIAVHGPAPRAAARARAVEMLDLVGIPSADTRFDQYPHEFSGGMRQRAMIAMALVNEPEILIADEPTTALDVTVQAQILALMGDLQRELGTASILITHDLGVVANNSDRVLIMYAGRIVEVGATRDILTDPEHPYTAGLLQSMPRLDRDRRPRLSAIPGTPPSMIHPPTGCSFHPRCPIRDDSHGCSTVTPVLESIAAGREVRCLLPIEERRGRNRDRAEENG